MKKTKLFFLYLFKYCGIFCIARLITCNKVRILCYHGVWLGPDVYLGDAIFMNNATFESRMKFLKDKKYSVVNLNCVVKSIKKGFFHKNSVVITIDDGWYSAYKEMVPILKKYNFPATIYCDTGNIYLGYPVMHVMARYLVMLARGRYVGIWKNLDDYHLKIYNELLHSDSDCAAKKEKLKKLGDYLSINIDDYLSKRVFSYVDPSELKEIYDEGIDIQLHTHSHNLGDFKDEIFLNELENNKAHIANYLHIDMSKLNHFCYPSGKYKDNLEDLFRTSGVISATTCDRSLVSVGMNPYYLPRIMDGENMSMIEFDAELCGLLYMLRKFKSSFLNLLSYG